MDFLQVLMAFIIMATIIKVAVDNVNAIILPITNIQKFSMLTAFIMSICCIFAYNKGMMESLNVPIDITLQPFFHYVDLCITTLVLTGGSKAIHAVVNGLNEYKSSKVVSKEVK